MPQNIWSASNFSLYIPHNALIGIHIVISAQLGGLVQSLLMWSFYENVLMLPTEGGEFFYKFYPFRCTAIQVHRIWYKELKKKMIFAPPAYFCINISLINIPDSYCGQKYKQIQRPQYPQALWAITIYWASKAKWYIDVDDLTLNLTPTGTLVGDSNVKHDATYRTSASPSPSPWWIKIAIWWLTSVAFSIYSLEIVSLL